MPFTKSADDKFYFKEDIMWIKCFLFALFLIHVKAWKVFDINNVSY